MKSRLLPLLLGHNLVNGVDHIRTIKHKTNLFNMET